MTGQRLRQTLNALRKQVRSLRDAGQDGTALGATEQPLSSAALGEDESVWFSSVLFGLIDSLGVPLTYAEARKLSHPSFAQALPPPEKSNFTDKAVAGLTPHMVSLGEAAFGWLYQIFCERLRNASLKSIQTSNKQCGAPERIAFTQIYTPDWVSDYLLEHCLSPQLDGRSSANNLPTVLDPACGAGNILLRALGFFARAARHQNQRQLMSEAMANLFGVDIDPVALFVANTALISRAKRAGGEVSRPANLLCVDDCDLGSLNRDRPARHILSGSYDAVVTNPPYIGRKLLDRQLKEQLKKSYPLAHHDLSAAFLLRGLELLAEDGRLGLITQSAQFFLPSFANMRKEILSTSQLELFVELGAGAFPLQSGEKVNSALIVLGKKQSTAPSKFIDLSVSAEKDTALLSPQPKVYEHHQSRFLKETGSAFNYKAPAFLMELAAVSTALSELADLRQGLATTDNARFVRQWWEVDPSEIGWRWVPYVKGAGSERWWAPIENVVLWENQGEAIKQAVRESYPYLNGKTAWVVKNENYYFRPGLVFSFVNTRQFCARQLPAGCIFDVAASAIFPCADPNFILGFLNSTFCAVQASLLNPTINFQVGDLKKLQVPVFDANTRQQISLLAAQCVEIKQSITEKSGTICGAGASKPTSTLDAWNRTCARRITQLAQTEHKIDALVLEHACVALNLNTAQRKELSDLCAEQQGRRRAPTIYPATDRDLEKLSIRARAVHV
jgi:methylase of polypeptide subunit release factors